MNNLDLEKGEYPIIIKPNLGQPILINLREFKNEKDVFIKKITFNALIIALPEQSIQEILEFFYSIYIQPILKDEGEFTERRGKKYPLQILKIEKIKKLDFRDQGVLEEENCVIWDIYNSLLKIDEIFGKRRELYKIKFQIKKTKTINRLLKETGRNLLLFDIVHDLPNRIVDKINYHSIALFNKKFADFSFIHATDFHVARRNDFILKFLKDKVREKVKLQEKHKRKLSKIDRSVLTRDFEFREEFQEERLKDLHFARYNFNYNLRKLISYINERVVKNELDFILMTGDLIDYNNIASGNYQYENNFQVFIDILLGRNRGLDKPPFLIEEEFVNKQEILAPIFTIVGNHDYRKAHYGINIGNINQIFGMTKKEIKGYHDARFVNYLKSIRSRDKYLKDYFRYLNPNLNFKVKIGKYYNFIFIDTGQDSIADMHDLLKGCPSTKGLKDEQIDLIRAYIQLSHDEKIVIVMHAPPISPNLNKKRKYKKKFKLKRKLQWSDFYEHNLKKYIGCARLDRVLNLKYQTIMYNFSNFLRICVGADKIIRRKIDLILAGHAHSIKEFRLKEMKETETISMGFYFTKIPINVPCEVYANKYREIFKKFENPQDFQIWFDVNKPFIFQTQPVGPIGLKYKFKPPGFRYFIIKNDQITDAKIYSLHLK